MLSAIRSAVASRRPPSQARAHWLRFKDHYRCQSTLGGAGEEGQGDKDAPEGQAYQPIGRPKIDHSRVPVINEEDLEEKFISGSGPGGQCVNKAVNCCQIKHKPTGIVVKVHQTRSLEQNRRIARELLVQRLDNLYNGEASVENQKRRLFVHRMSTREVQAEKRRALKEQYKTKLVGANQAGNDNQAQ